MRVVRCVGCREEREEGGKEGGPVIGRLLPPFLKAAGENGRRGNGIKWRLPLETHYSPPSSLLPPPPPPPPPLSFSLPNRDFWRQRTRGEGAAGKPRWACVERRGSSSCHSCGSSPDLLPLGERKRERACYAIFRVGREETGRGRVRYGANNTIRTRANV